MLDATHTFVVYTKFASIDVILLHPTLGLFQEFLGKYIFLSVVLKWINHLTNVNPFLVEAFCFSGRNFLTHESKSFVVFTVHDIEIPMPLKLNFER